MDHSSPGAQTWGGSVGAGVDVGVSIKSQAQSAAVSSRQRVNRKNSFFMAEPPLYFFFIITQCRKKVTQKKRFLHQMTFLLREWKGRSENKKNTYRRKAVAVL
jgi:hypothetical protein